MVTDAEALALTDESEWHREVEETIRRDNPDLARALDAIATVRAKKKER